LQSRVSLEKPLGTDLASAQAINARVSQYFARAANLTASTTILGKETVQNLYNGAAGVWRCHFVSPGGVPPISRVVFQITVAVNGRRSGSRAGFYNGAGAMRDMVQNHLLQLLCIVAMEPPISMNADDVRDEKLKVLRSLRKMDLSDIKRDTVRGHTAGNSEGLAAKGYREEANVPPDSRTETFVALKAHINNARSGRMCRSFYGLESAYKKDI
jgi:glucose-6-phosphate 1-dehydrogenase